MQPAVARGLTWETRPLALPSTHAASHVQDSTTPVYSELRSVIVYGTPMPPPPDACRCCVCRETLRCMQFGHDCVLVAAGICVCLCSSAGMGLTGMKLYMQNFQRVPAGMSAPMWSQIPRGRWCTHFSYVQDSNVILCRQSFEYLPDPGLPSRFHSHAPICCQATPGHCRMHSL